MKATRWALEKAAQAWCDKRTESLVMQPELAEVFAEMLDEIDAEYGNAKELLADAYIELSGKKIHAMDCATSSAPAYLPKKCNCTKQITKGY